MLTTSGKNLPTITESKICHHSRFVHRLARFVTEDNTEIETWLLG